MKILKRFYLHCKGFKGATKDFLFTNASVIVEYLLLHVAFLLSAFPVYSQNVGVGTYNPQAKLHIQVGSSYPNPLLLVDIQGASVPYFIVTSAGKVGIGIAAPSEALDISGNLQFSGALMPGGNAGTAGQVLVSQGVGTAPQWQDASSIGGDDWGGQVAVTTGPIVGNGTAGSPITFANGSASGDIWQWNGSSWQLVQLKTAVAGSGFDSVCSGAMSNYIQKWTGTELCNSVIYDDGTNIGIGTTTPTMKVEIYGHLGLDNTIGGINNETSLYLFEERNSPNESLGSANPSGNNKGWVMVSAGPNSPIPRTLRLQYWDGTQWNYRLTIDSLGRVGIGTTTPTHKLHIAGSGYIQDSLRLDGALRPGGNPGTPGQVLVSQGPNQPPQWQTLSNGIISFIGPTDTIYQGPCVGNTTLNISNSVPSTAKAVLLQVSLYTETTGSGGDIHNRYVIFTSSGSSGPFYRTGTRVTVYSASLSTAHEFYDQLWVPITSPGSITLFQSSCTSLLVEVIGYQ